VEFFREGGPGWQHMINQALRKASGKYLNPESFARLWTASFRSH